MTPEQWRQVRDLFEQAVDQPPGNEEAWVVQCADDSAVVAEVMSLLKHHTRAGAFLEAPVADHVFDLLADDERFEPGAVVGSYQIKRELGRGGMGRVYLATDTRLGRDVALKVLAPHLVRDESQRERLRREARAAALLTAPGICTVYALEEIDNDVVIAAEFVDGHTLRDEIARGPRPSPRELLETARELAAALAIAHARGITHRDLKPENVMRANSGRLKILDFGLALVASGVGDFSTPRVTTPGTLIGTPAYMAPEQLNAGVVDPRTDVFAFGVLLYECAIGHHPFDAALPLAMAARILEGEHEPLADARRDLPPQLTDAIERCLRKRPSERFASAADVADALAPSLGSVVVPAERADAGWWRRHVAIVLGLYLVAAIVGWLVKEWQHGLADGGFIAIAMLTTVAGTLRGHLLFAQRAHDAGSFLAELRRSTPAIVGLDLAMSAMLVVEGLLVTSGRSVPGVLIIGLGLGLAIARLVLEPSTTRVAFEEPGRRV